jgi:hypothetical protein
MRGLKIASVLSILSSEDMPSTAPYGKLNLCLSKIQSSLKHDDSNLWLGVLPATIDGWIRKVENLGIQYRVEEVNGTYTGIDKSDFKGTDWNRVRIFQTWPDTYFALVTQFLTPKMIKLKAKKRSAWKN